MNDESSTANMNDESSTANMNDESSTPIIPLTTLLKTPFWMMCCDRNCAVNNVRHFSEQRMLHTHQESNEEPKDEELPSPTAFPPSNGESIIHEYIVACNLYGCSDRINAGVLTALHFSIPKLRVSGSFHDADMLALSDVLIRHINGFLKYITRLDFSLASREGKLHGKKGFGSHGAYSLSKVLEKSRYIEEIYLQGNRIGPFGAVSIFKSISKNRVIRRILMRKCRIHERGAIGFVEHLCLNPVTSLNEVDMALNGIGYSGCSLIQHGLMMRAEKKLGKIELDLDGNLIFQEVMNSVTHGLGIILCLIGTILLYFRVKNKSTNHIFCCSIYSISLLVLYTSSTLFHSFFALNRTKFIFGILDHCGIYILIGGSYTPFIGIPLAEKPILSIYLLLFIWLLCFSGIFVTALFPLWKYRGRFSLTMYLCIGWCCMVCLPDMIEVLPPPAIFLIALGGVMYTAGVPFFLRNNNLDHSIWHCFVLAASVCHWLGVYLYVA